MIAAMPADLISPYKKTFDCIPDWPQVQARWEAYWDMAATDRPCLVVSALKPDRKTIPLPELRTIEDKFLNPEYILASALQRQDDAWLGGEAVPTMPYFMAATTTGCGEHLYFHEGGISLRPTMTSMDQPLAWHPGPADPWRVKIEAIFRCLLTVAPGRFIVPHIAQYPHIDLLTMLRGNEEMLLEMAIAPDLCRARLREMREPWLENHKYLRGLADAQNAGCMLWTGMWHPRYCFSIQADAAAVVSPEMFAELVLPEMDWLDEHLGVPQHFHTCGYKQHLDLCLSRPYLRCIQYSPSMKEPPNGPAHLEFYRRVQQSQRCLDLSAPIEHVEFLIRHLRPEGLCITTGVKSREEGEELLANAVKWCGTHIGACRTSR